MKIIFLFFLFLSAHENMNLTDESKCPSCATFCNTSKGLALEQFKISKNLDPIFELLYGATLDAILEKAFVEAFNVEYKKLQVIKDKCKLSSQQNDLLQGVVKDLLSNSLNQYFPENRLANLRVDPGYEVILFIDFFEKSEEVTNFYKHAYDTDIIGFSIHVTKIGASNISNEFAVLKMQIIKTKIDLEDIKIQNVIDVRFLDMLRNEN